MGDARIPKKVNLFAGLLSNEAALFQDAKERLEKIFGRIDYEGPEMNFTHTEYYKDEMGEALKRKFLSFEKLIDPEDICSVKIMTNSLEKDFSVSGRRRINIDPGYLDLSKIVLFSTKDYSHRVYLGKGIFAEVTLFYKDKSYNPWPWTYPDYKTTDYQAIFGKMRDIYKNKIGTGAKNHD